MMAGDFDMSRAASATNGPPRGGGGAEHEQRRLVDAIFPEDGSPSRLDPEGWRRLFDHLRSDACRSCRDYFDERRRRVLGSKAGDGLTEHEQDAIIASLPASLVDALEKSPDGPHAPQPIGSPKPRPGRFPLELAATLAAAAVIALVAWRFDWFRSNELAVRQGGVSVDWFCSNKLGELVPFAKTDGFCEPGAKTIAKARREKGGWSRFAVVACGPDARCKIVHQSSFGADGRGQASGPVTPEAKEIRAFAISSDRDLTDDEVEHAAHSASEKGRSLLDLDTLPLDSSWPQEAVTVHAR